VDMIAIVDYGMGNLGSIANMLKKVGAQSKITSDPQAIEAAEKLILPGVGAFDNGMKNLTQRGLVELLNLQVLQRKKPILGLCLGMQLFTRASEEGQRQGLAWVNAQTVRFKFDETNAHLKVPHMGWNTLRINRPHPLLADLETDARFYFVHSYHLLCNDPENVLATTTYGYDFASIVAQDNILGAQFHPEKSHKFGMKLLKNFAERV
jgi:glutamine amidotransferase